MKLMLSFALVTLLAGCSSHNKEYVEKHACDTWQSLGYECIGYEGFKWGFWVGGNYGGAYVWHTLRRKEAPGIIYSGAIQRWGDELHAYGPKAIDAIQPRN